MNITKVAASVTSSLMTYLRQPSTVLGLSALVGALTAMVIGQLSWQGAIPAIAGALAAIVLPDNAGAQAAIKDAAAAAVQAEQAIVAQRVGLGSTASPGTNSLVPVSTTSVCSSSQPRL